MSSHASLPGFRDFYPSDLSIRTHITNAWRTAAHRHAFEEYDGPPLETLELYTGKSGEEIVGQLYHFEDKGGRAVALRPEMTPTLARMVSARAGALRKPIRWFSIPQLFRYERTQRGRLREHFQWNVDVIGETAIDADAEVLATALDALALLGLGPADVVARFSDRRLLERLLLHSGVPSDRLGAAYAGIDKLGRDPADQVRESLQQAGLTGDQVARLLSLFEGDGLAGLESRFGSVPGLGEDLDRLRQYEEQLGELGHADAIAFDLRIVRGLAYYTGTVFEVFDRAGELRAICGGGRYDRLLEAVGGADLPGVGFGMGDVVLAELLAEHGRLPETRARLDFFVVTVSDAQRPMQRRLATRLRRAGHSVGFALRAQSVGRQFKEADARGAGRVIILGPDEMAAGVMVVREMATGEERRLPLDGTP